MKIYQESLITSGFFESVTEDKKEVEKQFYPSIMSGMFFKTLPLSGNCIGVRFPDSFEEGLGFPATLYSIPDTVSEIRENLSQIHDLQLKSRKLFEHYDFLMENFIDNEQIFNLFELERESFNEEYLRYCYLKINGKLPENQIMILLANRMTLIDLKKILGTYKKICDALKIDYKVFCSQTGLKDPSNNKWLKDQPLMQNVNREIEYELTQKTITGKYTAKEVAILKVLKKHNLKIYNGSELCTAFGITNTGNFFKAQVTIFKDKIHFPFHYAEEEQFIREVRNTAKCCPAMIGKLEHIVERYQQSGYKVRDVRYFADIYHLDYNSIASVFRKVKNKEVIKNDDALLTEIEKVLEENKPSTSLSNCL
ncbi:MAG: hypothetical protein H2069_09280 [Legionella sp.]|nr:hypothetical protein [Legionella sp.]